MEEELIEEVIPTEEELIDGYRSTTQCDHFMVLEDPFTAICQKGCGHGCAFNPEESEIVDGKIMEKT